MPITITLTDQEAAQLSAAILPGGPAGHRPPTLESARRKLREAMSVGHTQHPVARVERGPVHLPALIADEFGISRSEARRLIAQGGVALDDELADDLDWWGEELHGKTLRVGSRRFRRLRIEDPYQRYVNLES